MTLDSDQELDRCLEFNPLVDVYRIHVPESRNLQINNQRIKKIEFIRTETNFLKRFLNFCGDFFIIYFQDETWKIYQSDPEDLHYDKMIIIANVLSPSAEIELNFSLFPDTNERREVIDFSLFWHLDGYIESQKAYYTELRSEIANIAADEISQKKELLRRVNQYGVTLLCLGCGNGDDTKEITTILESKLGSHVSGFGVDISEVGIARAKTKYRDYSFFTGDARNSSDIIDQCINAGGADRDSVFVVAAPGLLNHSVMEGTYPALQVLQQVARSRKVDFLLLGGYTASLVNRSMAQASGWQLQIRTIRLSKQHLRMVPEAQEAGCPDAASYLTPTIQFLTPEGIPEQVGLVKLASEYRSSNPVVQTLDLAMSSFPDELFSRAIQEQSLQNVVNVDLSWSAFPESWQSFAHGMHEMGIKTVLGFRP